MISRSSVLVAAALLQGCATLIGGTASVKYLDARAIETQFTPARPTRSVRLLNGETVEAAPLSDDAEALMIRCPTLEIDERFKSREQLAYEHRAAATAIRTSCLLDAARICRLHQWNGNSSFALMDEVFWHGSAGVTHAMFVRCLTREAYSQFPRQRGHRRGQEGTQ